ncbi:uncharacterized protein LOC106006672 isoform X1 [Mustela putorius furo]|uniref:Uncharacterized protein LOC106006672 isoform X1 n=1 Tax=Mustela putorius furo TaxID=9669 RepID=A0A8U0TFP3_MUSPF|nr:uncharacterized protein LOC106006672 isoform X1 [Mustela putorius furo]
MFSHSRSKEGRERGLLTFRCDPEALYGRPGANPVSNLPGVCRAAAAAVGGSSRLSDIREMSVPVLSHFGVAQEICRLFSTSTHDRSTRNACPGPGRQRLSHLVPDSGPARRQDSPVDTCCKHRARTHNPEIKTQMLHRLSQPDAPKANSDLDCIQSITVATSGERTVCDQNVFAALLFILQAGFRRREPRTPVLTPPSTVSAVD